MLRICLFQSYNDCCLHCNHQFLTNFSNLGLKDQMLTHTSYALVCAQMSMHYSKYGLLDASSFSSSSSSSDWQLAWQLWIFRCFFFLSFFFLLLISSFSSENCRYLKLSYFGDSTRRHQLELISVYGCFELRSLPPVVLDMWLIDVDLQWRTHLQ